jgi:hypothetical protein
MSLTCTADPLTPRSWRPVSVPRSGLSHVRLGLRRQRDTDLENAVGEGGLDVFELDAFGQRHRAVEAAVLALGSIEVVLLLFLLALSFT